MSHVCEVPPFVLLRRLGLSTEIKVHLEAVMNKFVTITDGRINGTRIHRHHLLVIHCLPDKISSAMLFSKPVAWKFLLTRMSWLQVHHTSTPCSPATWQRVGLALSPLATLTGLLWASSSTSSILLVRHLFSHLKHFILKFFRHNWNGVSLNSLTVICFVGSDTACVGRSFVEHV